MILDFKYLYGCPPLLSAIAMRTPECLTLFLITVLLAGCETDPVISIPSKPLPVMYAILDDQDSIHQIVVEKSFGATYDPATEAKIHDSLFFDDIRVRVFTKPPVIYGNPSWEEIPVYKDLETRKDSGYFNYPNREYFYFISTLRAGWTKYVDSVKISLEIPGYDSIYCQVEILDTLKVSTPKKAQQYIYLTPSSTFKIHWDHSEPGEKPHAMNEIDVQFEFIEETKLGNRSKFVKIQNTQWVSAPTETFREMSITYEEFIKEVLQQIPVNDSVLRTFLGYINIHIAGADTNLVQYKKYINGYSDYHFGGFSNIKNGMGLITSVTHWFKDSMRFDYETRQILINENRLKKLKISPWTE